MQIKIRIKPGVEPRVRYAFEDKLDALLERYDGEVTGGGGAVDLSDSNIAFETETPVPMDELRRFIDGSSLSGEITLFDLAAGEALLTFHTTARPWWKFW
jgi:hypothetical protein